MWKSAWLLMATVAVAYAYNYEQPARVLNRVDDEAKRDPQHFVSTLKDPPTDPLRISSLVDDNDLTHGDILRFGGNDRDVFSVIVARQSSGDFALVHNPDDAGAGYITIPREVAAPVDDCRRKYAAVIADAPMINFHLTGNDAFIRDLFQGAGPVEWDYDLPFMWGQPEGALYITPPGGRPGEFFLRGLTWEQVKQHFQ